MNDRFEHRNMPVVWTKFSSYGDEYLKSQLRNYCDDCGDLVGSALRHSLATGYNGRLSDMTNLTRAKDAVACFMETEERRQRGRHSPSEGCLCVKPTLS